MSKEIIRETIEKEMPVLDLLDMKYIDKKNSHMSSIGDDWLRDGKFYFKLNIDKVLFREQLSIVFENIMKNYFNQYSMQSDDDYYIMYEPDNKLSYGMEDKSKGGITVFALKRDGNIYRECGGIIGSTLMFMDVLKHPKLEEVKQQVSKFANDCFNWIREQIRNKTNISGVKGDFCIDDIQIDTYMQRRKSSKDKIYDYIIHDWCRRLANNEPITWVDLMGEDKVYVALD